MWWKPEREKKAGSGDCRGWCLERGEAEAGGGGGSRIEGGLWMVAASRSPLQHNSSQKVRP